MKHFKYQTPGTFDEAEELLKSKHPGEAAVMAGGTDLLGVLKDELLLEYPETIVALRDIPDTAYIEEENSAVRIGAMTTLDTIEENAILQADNLKAISKAAYSVASPIIRSRATLGGNLCQDVRCWFYRYPGQVGGTLAENRLPSGNV